MPPSGQHLGTDRLPIEHPDLGLEDQAQLIGRDGQRQVGADLQPSSLGLITGPFEVADTLALGLGDFGSGLGATQHFDGVAAVHGCHRERLPLR